MIKAQTSKDKGFFGQQTNPSCVHITKNTFQFSKYNKLFQQVTLIVFIQLWINNFTLWADNLKLQKLQGTLPEQRKETG